MKPIQDEVEISAGVARLTWGTCMLSVYCRHRVLYDYQPRHADELELREGDLVTVMRRFDDGWCVGVHGRTSCVGTFPGNYVS